MGGSPSPEEGHPRPVASVTCADKDTDFGTSLRSVPPPLLLELLYRFPLGLAV